MKEIYCTTCLKVTPHKGELDHNNEFIFSCQTEGCGMFVKFPRVKDAQELDTLIANREAIHKPLAEMKREHDEQDVILKQILGDGTSVSVTREEGETQAQ